MMRVHKERRMKWIRRVLNLRRMKRREKEAMRNLKPELEFSYQAD